MTDVFDVFEPIALKEIKEREANEFSEWENNDASDRFFVSKQNMGLYCPTNFHLNGNHYQIALAPYGLTLIGGFNGHVKIKIIDILKEAISKVEEQNANGQN